MSRLLFVALTLLVVIALFMPATRPSGGRAAEPPSLSPSERQQRLRERDRLWAEAPKLQAAGKLAEAIAATEKVLAIEHGVFGAGHQETTGTLDYLAELHEGRGDFAAARQARQELLTIRRKLDGAEHWRVTDARLALEDLERRSRMTAAQRQRLGEAIRLSGEVVALYGRGKFREAVPAAQQALAIRKEALGDKHPLYAQSLSNLAVLYESMADNAKAEPLYRQALAIKKEALGDKHPDYATSLNNLAGLYQAMGDYGKAEPLFRQARDIRKEALGDKHPSYATSLNNLAALSELQQRLKECVRLREEALKLQNAGKLAEAIAVTEKILAIERSVFGAGQESTVTLDYLAELHEGREDFAAARQARRQALALLRARLGASHWQVTDARLALEDLERRSGMTPAQRQRLGEASRLNGVAGILHRRGKFREAVRAAQQALAIRKEALGERHPSYATSLNNLAGLYQAMGDSAKAEPLFRQALAIDKEALGDKHPDYAMDLNNLAHLYQSMGDSAKAEPLYRQALAINKQALGDKHPGYATGLNNLAELYVSMGDSAKAESLHRQARDIRKEALGDKHPDYAQSLNNLAVLYRAMGDYAKAEPLLRQALAIDKEALGEKHHGYATNLHNLAQLYHSMGDYAKAEPLFQQALAIDKEALGDKHPSYAIDLNNLAALYEDMGDYAKAEPLYRQALAITKQTLGDKHPSYATSLDNLAQLYKSMGDYAQAEPLHRQALAINKEALGDKHPHYATGLNNLAQLYESMGDYGKAEPLIRQALAINKEALGDKHPHYATSLNNLAGLYQAMGDYVKAEPLLRQALAITKEALGEKHPSYAANLNNLAVLYCEMGDFTKAEPLGQQALSILKKRLGEKHPHYASGLNNLAGLYHSMGDYAKAEPLHRQALAINKEALGDKHPSYAADLNNLAALYNDMGDFAKAEPLYRQASVIWREALGDKHRNYATSLDNLATLYLDMGDYAKAEPVCRQALAIKKKALGEKHPDCTTSLNNLATLYLDMGDYAKAEPLYRQALDIRKETLGEKHPHYAVSLDNLASLYSEIGEYTKAEPLVQKALAIRKEKLGEKHSDYATSLHNLALLYESQGLYAKAEPLYRQAQAINKQTLGEKHSHYVTDLTTLASLYEARGDYAQAERFLRQGLEISRANLDLAATAQSERQQLAMARQLRRALDHYLALAPKGKRSGGAVYSQVLAWKGVVLSRQRRLRLQRSHPELTAAFAQLDRVAGRLAALALAVPDPKRQAVFRQQIQELTEEKERLEGDLARQSAAFRQERETEKLTPAHLQAALPPDAALIDFLEYTHSSQYDKGKRQWQFDRRLAAFVVRRDSIQQLDLGPAQPITEAIDRWRRTTKRTRPVMGENDPAAELRRRLWQPLEPHLRGARVVLVSPDWALARLPLAALPGRKPDTYLLEEVSLAVVPVPQLLPELLAAGKADAKPEPSLLLVGDVDFDAAPELADARGGKRTAVRGNRAGVLMQFQRLDATREEIVAVADSFRRGHRRQKVLVSELRDDEATEAAVRSQAPKHRYVHLATHGFFAPPELLSALAPVPAAKSGPAAADLRGTDLFGRRGVSGFHPGLLSGLALAGANRPAGADVDDGILTALEVAELDLSGVELAALSACETGLGETAGGEGLLGLQRAFQTAGARSVVASLWQVDDEATRKLMVRFYENLWRAKEPLGKLAALREAQLWMLREGVRRGLVRLTEEEALAKTARTPPYYWAAFVLSGDWR
jgi:tetratricopeptide (TPR) repeat protein